MFMFLYSVIESFLMILVHITKQTTYWNIRMNIILINPIYVYTVYLIVESNLWHI